MEKKEDDREEVSAEGVAELDNRNKKALCLLMLQMEMLFWKLLLILWRNI